jgi:hypothetical protein
MEGLRKIPDQAVRSHSWGDLTLTAPLCSVRMRAGLLVMIVACVVGSILLRISFAWKETP